MHSAFNQRLLNKNQSQGHVASYFENLHTLIQCSNSTRSFILRTVNCHDQSASFSESQETRIQITHDDHMISQINDGFFTFKVQLTGIDSTFNDSNNLCKLFVVFKSSNQIFDQLQILCRNSNISYQQNECCREGFAYSTIKPYNEKKTRKYTHSLYDNVSTYYHQSVVLISIFKSLKMDYSTLLSLKLICPSMISWLFKHLIYIQISGGVIYN